MLIRAEGGAGKTTLAAQWLHHHPRTRAVWVTIDESAANSKSFWFRTFAALSDAFPEQFSNLADAHATGLIGSQEGPPLLASALLRDPDPFVFIFDDLDLVTDEVQQQLVTLLHRVPHLRVIATSRHRTRFESPQVAPFLGARIIDSQDLAFTRTELAELAKDLRVPLDQETLAAIEHFTRGHTLAVRLALSLIQSLSRYGSRKPNNDTIVRGLESLAHDFLPSFSDEQEAQLAHSIAYAPETDRALAERLLDDSRAWDIIERFERQGLGRMAARRGRRVFLMHTLVASALRNNSTELISSERVKQIHTVIYDHLRDLADPIDMLNVLVKGGMDSEAWPHFLKHSLELLLHRTHELTAVLESLPQQRLESTPELAIILAGAISEGLQPVPTRALSLARIGLAGLNDSTEAGADGRGALLTLLAKYCGYRVLRDFEAAAAAGDDVVEQIDELIGTGDDAVASTARMHVLFTYVLAHRIERLEAMTELVDNDHHLGRRMHTTSLRAFVQAYSGNMLAAERSMNRVRGEGSSARYGSRHAILLPLAEALQRANLGDAGNALEIIQPLIQQLDGLELWPTVLWTHGTIQLISGQVQAGLTDIEHYMKACDDYPLSAGWKEQLCSLHADLLVASGDLPSARTLLSRAGTAPSTRLADARTHLLLSQPGKALALLDAPSSSGYLPAQQAQRTLLRAIAHEALGNEQAATLLAKRGFVKLHRLGHRISLSMLTADGYASIARLASFTETTPLALPFQNDRLLTTPLTSRESLILSELATGDSLRQLAQRLHVSPNTVKTQTRSIYRKLGASDRTDAIRKAAHFGLL